MKSAWKILSSLIIVYLIGLALLHSGNNAVLPLEVAAEGPEQHVLVSEPVQPGTSVAVRDLPAPPNNPVLNREINPRNNPLLLEADMGQTGTHTTGIDPLVQKPNGGTTPDPILNFDGIPTQGFTPPDTVGEVGPNHYVQMVNVQFAMYDKTGTQVQAPRDFNQLWNGQGGICETQNDGDPIVVYDRMADRWLLSQFAQPQQMCIAISQTADPTGSYHLYEFDVGAFPDYFKFGVWPDGYYMSANEVNDGFGYTAYVFDRTNMLAGNAATFQKFDQQTNLLLPSDLDGATQPPADSPNYFYTFKDNDFPQHGGGDDRLEIFAFDVDWTTPANSTFTLVTTIPIASFNYTVCGFFIFDCIPQPNPGESLDALSDWPMWRLQYRNFGSHETLVGNFTVDTNGSDHAGIRWFELRKSGSDAWSLHQEGTHAPDDAHRWLGSIAMDQSGNIALGYSVSSSTINPSIRYATRLAADAAGTLQSEATLVAGGGVQTAGGSRWGDYSSMNVDPADDCTFWYTSEYYESTSEGNWQTRIGTFKIPSCGDDGGDEADLSISKTAAPNPVVVNNPLIYTLSISNGGPMTTTNVMVTDTLPMSMTFGSATSSMGSCQHNSGTVTCDLGTLVNQASVTVTLVVTPTAMGEFTNTATISGSESDSNTGNNSASVSVTVNDSPTSITIASFEKQAVINWQQLWLLLLLPLLAAASYLYLRHWKTSTN